MTIAQAYIDFKNELKTIYGESEVENISDWVFENVTGQKKWERRNNQNELEEVYAGQLKNHLQELLQHKPVQYVLNEAWFYKMKFFVNENVLIPRPETEELVEWIVGDVQCGMYDVPCKDSTSNTLNILDVGTGSGCIPISLKKELPLSNVTSLDVSKKALNVAKKNAAALQAEIDFLQVDFLNEKNWNTLLQYDIIVSNPPYIPIQKKNILQKNVADFEPALALFVLDNHPFIFYEKMATFAQTNLKKTGRIYVEVHEEYAQNIKSIFENAGFYAVIKKDIYGKERMVSTMVI